MLSVVVRHFIFSSHCFSPTATSPRAWGPAALFQPLISVSRSPLYECDWNFHKSNSTYFSDLDVTRHGLIACLLREGFIKVISRPGAILTPEGIPVKGLRYMMLGSVQCTFRKEILPYQPYEMWSRILCWDRKWIYVVTHFVKRGDVKPDGRTLNSVSLAFEKVLTNQNKSKPEKRDVQNTIISEQNDAILEVPNEAIYASAISRYVAKSGRLTIHPEVILVASGLLPPRPGGWNTMPFAKEDEKDADPHKCEKETARGSEDIWGWRRVEAEHARGIKLTASLDYLEELTWNLLAAVDQL